MRTEIFLIIMGMATVTFLTRFTPVAIFRKTGVPLWFERWMKHVPTGILTALIIPALLLPKGHLDISIENHYLLAGMVAVMATYLFRNIIVSMSLGLAVMVSLRWLEI